MWHCDLVTNQRPASLSRDLGSANQRLASLSRDLMCDLSQCIIRGVKYLISDQADNDIVCQSGIRGHGGGHICTALGYSTVSRFLYQKIFWRKVSTLHLMFSFQFKRFTPHPHTSILLKHQIQLPRSVWLIQFFKNSSLWTKCHGVNFDNCKKSDEEKSHSLGRCVRLGHTPTRCMTWVRVVTLVSQSEVSTQGADQSEGGEILASD